VREGLHEGEADRVPREAVRVDVEVDERDEVTLGLFLLDTVMLRLGLGVGVAVSEGVAVKDRGEQEVVGDTLAEAEGGESVWEKDEQVTLRVDLDGVSPDAVRVALVAVGLVKLELKDLVTVGGDRDAVALRVREGVLVLLHETEGVIEGELDAERVG
jgi:hypothetical protein